MKSTKSILAVLCITIYVSSMNAKYYKPSRKNKALLLSNAYSLDKIPVLTSSLEFGHMYNRVLVQVKKSSLIRSKRNLCIDKLLFKMASRLESV
jgi:hypothetical protein